MWTNSFPQAVLADNLRKFNFDIKYFFYKDISEDHSINLKFEKTGKGILFATFVYALIWVYFNQGLS